jgi:hypothetical protein
LPGLCIPAGLNEGDFLDVIHVKVLPKIVSGATAAVSGYLPNTRCANPQDVKKR